MNYWLTSLSLLTTILTHFNAVAQNSSGPAVVPIVSRGISSVSAPNSTSQQAEIQFFKNHRGLFLSVSNSDEFKKMVVADFEKKNSDPLFNNKLEALNFSYFQVSFPILPKLIKILEIRIEQLPETWFSKYVFASKGARLNADIWNDFQSLKSEYETLKNQALSFWSSGRITYLQTILLLKQYNTLIHRDLTSSQAIYPKYAERAKSLESVISFLDTAKLLPNQKILLPTAEPISAELSNSFLNQGILIMPLANLNDLLREE